MTPNAKAAIQSMIWTDFFLSNAYLSQMTRHSSSRLPWGWTATEKRHRYLITYCPTGQNLCISCTDLSEFHFSKPTSAGVRVAYCGEKDFFFLFALRCFFMRFSPCFYTFLAYFHDFRLHKY